MAHIRLFRHYIHTPFLLSAAAEALAIGAAAYIGFFTRYGEFPGYYAHLPYAVTFALVNLFCMAAMGVYEARLREGYMGVLLRTAVAMFLLGTLGMAVILYFAVSLSEGRGVLLIATVEAFAMLTVLRWLTSWLVGEDALKRRVLIYGTGHRALKIASRMRRRSDRRAFVLVGFLRPEGMPDLVSEFGARILPPSNLDLQDYCRELDVDEIVVATDERRANEMSAVVPFDQLVDCRLSGIEVCEVQNFVEREAGKLDIDLLQRSWMVYSDGFVTGWFRASTKRSFDLLAATGLLVMFSPVMILSAFAVLVSDRCRGPVLYRQDRVGLNGRKIRVIKFRTMQVDAEESGAVWADHDDPRVTPVGRFLRKSRIDELPQLINVLKGEMSMVGPRPERPVFVDHLSAQLPFYDQRHRIKPGITGWAQLCHPYGASVADAKEKLQYDLYYLKNHSILLDLIILMQTVEVVLVGEGAR
jgi:sugar transferase (PEP-CTERM system associated)